MWRADLFLSHCLLSGGGEVNENTLSDSSFCSCAYL